MMDIFAKFNSKALISEDTIGKCTEKYQLHRLLADPNADKLRKKFNKKTGKYEEKTVPEKLREKMESDDYDGPKDPNSYCGQKHLPLIYCKTMQNVIMHMLNKDEPFSKFTEKDVAEIYGYQKKNKLRFLHNRSPIKNSPKLKN